MLPRPPNAIVLDSGSGVCRAGFVLGDTCRSVQPSVVGVPLHPVAPGMRPTEEGLFVCDEAIAMCGVLSLSYPKTHGLVCDWPGLERVWACVLRGLGAGVCSEMPILITEPVLCPHQFRERAMQVLFESHEVPALSFACQPELSLRASGRSTGCVLKCGDGVTQVVAVVDGVVQAQVVSRCEWAGSDVTLRLAQLLGEQGLALHASSSGLEVVRCMKEKLAYVSLSYNEHLLAPPLGTQAMYVLPDDSALTLSSERFMCAEPLFQPSLVGRAGGGVHELVAQAVMLGADTAGQSGAGLQHSLALAVRDRLASSVVLSGGTTLLPGFGARLHQELARCLPAGAPVRVVEPLDRKYSSYIGGCMLAATDGFASRCVSRSEYLELGPAALLRKRYGDSE